MRDISPQNLSVLPHLIRRHMHDRLRGTASLPRSGSLWKQIADTFLDAVVISPNTEPPAGDHVTAAPRVRIADLTIARVLRLYAQQAGDPDTGANIELNWTGHLFPSSGRKDDYDFGDGVLINVTGFAASAGAVSLTGIEDGTGYSGTNNGRVIILVNNCGHNITFKHKDSNGSLGMQIVTPTGADLVMGTGTAVLLVYVRTHSGPMAYEWYVFPLSPTLANLVSHKVLGDHSDSASGTIVRGDFFRGSSAAKMERVAIPTAQWVLGSDGTDLVALDRRVVRLSSDPTRNATSLADVTGLSFSVEANVAYEFEFNIVWSSNTNTTNGILLSVNGPASPTMIAFHTRIANGANDRSFQNEVLRAYDAGTATSEVPATGQAEVATIKGNLRNGSNAGTLIVRFASENALNEVQIWNGSSGWIHKLP